MTALVVAVAVLASLALLAAAGTALVWRGLARALRTIGHVPLYVVDALPARQLPDTHSPATGIGSLAALPRPAFERDREIRRWGAD